MASLVQQPFELSVSDACKSIGGSLVQQDNGLKASVSGSESNAVVIGVFDGHAGSRAAPACTSMNTVQTLIYLQQPPSTSHRAPAKDTTS